MYTESLIAFSMTQLPILMATDCRIGLTLSPWRKLSTAMAYLFPGHFVGVLKRGCTRMETGSRLCDGRVLLVLCCLAWFPSCRLSPVYSVSQPRVAGAGLRPVNIQICSGWDSRLVSILQHGDGAGSRPRLAIFEADIDGDKLKFIRSLELKNDVAPCAIEVCVMGRFVVTVDDLRSLGTGENVVVVYDLVANESSSWSLKEFIPPQVAIKLEGHDWFAGTQWCQPNLLCDSVKGIVIVTKAEDARRKNLPYVIVDLRARRPVVVDTPPTDSESVVQVRMLDPTPFGWNIDGSSGVVVSREAGMSLPLVLHAQRIPLAGQDMGQFLAADRALYKYVFDLESACYRRLR